jgi:hypothetical protein
MDLYRIIGDLVAERERLQRLIVSLEAMQIADGKPARVLAAGGGRKPLGASARADVSARMKSYWAKRRANEGKSDRTSA